MMLGALGAFMLGVATTPAHADSADDALKPVRKLTASTAETVCKPELRTMPVVSQYGGVVAGVCA